MSSRGSANILIIILIAMLILATLALVVVNRAAKSRSEIPVLDYLPEFEFTESNGRPFGLTQMKGKINIVDFIFTSCRTACPIMATNMSELYRFYEGSDLVQFISISVDPERDTFETLRAYAEQLGVTDDRWVFLRAPIDDVVVLSEEGFMLAADRQSLPMGHTTRFILVDRDGRIRSYHEGLDRASVNILKHNIRVLAKEMR
jgi:protein SCO1/2